MKKSIMVMVVALVSVALVGCGGAGLDLWKVSVYEKGESCTISGTNPPPRRLLSEPLRLGRSTKVQIANTTCMLKNACMKEQRMEENISSPVLIRGITLGLRKQM